MIPRPLLLGPLAAALLAACGNPGPTTGTTSGGAPPPPVSAATIAPVLSATASAAPLPTADPEPVRTAASPVDAGPPHDAGAKPTKPVTTAAPHTSAVASASASAAAAPVSPALAIARQVDAIFAAKKTFTARFDQQFTIQATNSSKSSSGVAFMERPSKLSFRYDPPNNNRIVSDGATLKIYDADSQQMIVSPAAGTAYPGAMAFMMGNGIATSFDFAINDKAKYAGVVLDGKPLTPNPSYELVMFYIDKDLLAKADPGAITRVLVRDAQGNRNRFDFKGSSQPATIDAAEFTFTPPAGTNIVNH